MQAINKINCYEKENIFYNGLEYELDEWNRMIYSKNLNTPDEYIELKGKQYRVGDSYYTYFEGGFSVVSCSKIYHVTLGAVDRWSKTDRLFSENGILMNVYFSYDGEQWDVYEKSESLYAYVGNDITGHEPKEKTVSSESEAYGIPGAIVVTTKDNAEVTVYNITGSIVKIQSVTAGATRIDVPQRGLFFVTVNNNSFKVFVR